MTGLKLRRFKDTRRYDFHRTFGTAEQLVDCEFDRNLSNFNQNEPNPVTGDPALPNGCTAFARADIATNEDRIIYEPGFTYAKTCLIEGVPVGEPCTLESSFKSGVVYGLQAVGEVVTAAQALTHRRGPYFEVTLAPGLDWFDSLWSALLKAQKGLSVGTLWYPALTEAQTVDTVAISSTTDGHNWEATGVTTQDGVPRIHVKWWGGEPKWFGRAAVNALMAAKGSDCLVDVDGKATPADIQTVRLTIIETLISYLQRLLAAFQPTAGATSTAPSLFDRLEAEEQEIADEITQLLFQPKPMNPDTMLPWGSASNNYHNVRVLADLAGLSLDDKNDLCACIYQESGFDPNAQHANTNAAGVILSTDYGICQINDYYHIGPGKDFPSVEYVLDNPEADVKWMISMLQHGLLKQWVSFSSGAYLQWLKPTSPMWALFPTPRAPTTQ